MSILWLWPPLGVNYMGLLSRWFVAVQRQPPPFKPLTSADFVCKYHHFAFTRGEEGVVEQVGGSFAGLTQSSYGGIGVWFWSAWSNHSPIRPLSI